MRYRQRGKISLIGERGKNSERALNKTHARAHRSTVSALAVKGSAEK